MENDYRCDSWVLNSTKKFNYMLCLINVLQCQFDLFGVVGFWCMCYQLCTDLLSLLCYLMLIVSRGNILEMYMRNNLEY